MSNTGLIADSPLPRMAGVSFALGVAFHHVIRSFEIDNKAWQLAASYLGVVTALLYVQVAHLGLPAAAVRTVVAANGFNVGLTTSLLLYRGFFHRLHRFPGPFWAKLTRFYATRNAAKNLQANVDTQRLHESYGDFVRIGPREISINRASAIQAIYGPPTRCLRSPWYSQVSDDVTKISLNSTRDLELHRRRKKAWDRGLGFRALSLYEPRIIAKADLLLSRIKSFEGEPVDITEYAMFFGFDVMGQVGFSKDFQMLESGREHPATRGLHENMSAVGILGTVPWLLSLLSKIPGATGSYSRFTDWCGEELRAKREAVKGEKLREENDDPKDVMSWLLRAEDEGDQSAPPGGGAFQEDARLMIIAGRQIFDTTSVALTNALYFLTKYPMCYQKLQNLVKAEFPGGDREWSYEKTKKIAYVDYIIQETLRLKPSIPAGLTRLTPTAGLQIDEVTIPGDTIVSVPPYTIQRDERYWKSALEFIPERWEDLSTDKTPWIPFTRGQFSCPGRNLAFMELRIVLSRIALLFDVSFTTGFDLEAFDVGAKDTFTLKVPPLPMIFTPATL